MKRYKLIIQDFQTDSLEVIRIRTSEGLEVMGGNTIIIGETIITTAGYITEVEEEGSVINKVN